MFFVQHYVPRQLKNRILSFLELQWDLFHGFSILSEDRHLLADAPDPLINQVHAARCLQFFRNCALFHGLDKEKLTYLATKGDIICMQPNEFVQIAGEISPCCYFIDQGYAEVL